MAKPEKQQIVTKKHMARQEREDRQTRILITIGIVILAIVAILVGIAVVDAYIITPNKPVATVNGEVITASDYQTRVKFERAQLVNQFNSTIQFMQSLQDDATSQYFQTTLQQIAFQLTPTMHGQSVLDTMIEDVLIQQEADKLGVTVSEAEIDEYFFEAFGYFPNGTPTSAPASEAVPTSTLSPQQLTLVPQEPTVEAGSTEGTDATPTDEPAVEPTEALPTPTVYTEEAFEQNYKDAMESYKQGVNISEDQFRGIVRADILREKMSKEITQEIPQVEEQIWARHILVETEEEALDVLARLEAGEDFAALAMELSTDTGSGANGGDLGWFGRGRMVPPFEEAAFTLEIGEISNPVQSDFGWHIIQKLGHEIRPIDEATYNQLQQTAFSDWLAMLRVKANVETDDTWQEVYPETPVLPPEYLAFLGL